MIQKQIHALNNESGSLNFYFTENNILQLIYKSTALHTEEEALENVKIFKELIDGAPRLMLIDVTHIKSMTRGAREIYAKISNEKNVIAIALLTKSLVSKIVGNFFIGFNKPVVPTKLFVDKTEAREWLKKQEANSVV